MVKVVLVELYRVAEVRGVDGAAAPPEISERFQGRLFTKHELEARGVRIAGAQAWFMANGHDWRLILEHAL
ncbi:MAG: hypothetical protein M3336_18560 [Chloroflexota bacterium]|nr:hypothetical protein [Chloroflexota bacterium]